MPPTGLNSAQLALGVAGGGGGRISDYESWLMTKGGSVSDNVTLYKITGAQP